MKTYNIYYIIKLKKTGSTSSERLRYKHTSPFTDEAEQIFLIEIYNVICYRSLIGIIYCIPLRQFLFDSLH